MTIHDYLDECILLLTVSSVVERFQVVKKREVETDGYLRARAILKGFLFPEDESSEKTFRAIPLNYQYA